ncbi:N2227-like protein-domain-containing protein [Mycena galericulata]|nr:N2227-like protein-domain-containing protein [Mycena galericulata]
MLAGLGYQDKLDRVDAAIEFLAQGVAQPEILARPPAPAHSHHSHSHSHSHGHGHGHAKRYKPTDCDMDKLRSTLKQFVRDWSEQGREEREACTPMTSALLEHFAAVLRAERSRLRVLVPGAGLGRLAHDVAALGASFLAFYPSIY